MMDERPLRTWRTPLRVVLHFGLPLLGVAVVVHYAVASIGGNINRVGFAFGVRLVAASASARLVSGR